MTSRERWLAALRFQSLDRLPFWPKLDAAYTVSRRPPFDRMSIPEIHAYIGSDRHEWLPSILREPTTNTSVESETTEGYRRTIYRTPVGTATAADRFDHASQSWHPVELPIKGLEDVHIMTEFYSDVRPELDQDRLERVQAVCRELRDAAVTAYTIGESPLMLLAEWLAGVENAHLLLADHTAEMEALFDSIHRTLVRRAEIVAQHCPADLLYMGENTSTTLISPDQYRRYCLPHIRAYAEIVRACGKPFVLHMCGHLKAILPELAGLPVDGFEAFTSPTVGNVTLAEGRAACPDKCLIGGTNAILWTRPASEIIAQIEHGLAELPHHRGIVVTSAGVMPPICEPQTIREVCEWVKGYPSRM